MELILISPDFDAKNGVAESWDDFTQFGTNFQWFQPPIHPAFMQRRFFLVIGYLLSPLCWWNDLIFKSINSSKALLYISLQY